MTRLLRNPAWLTVTVRCACCSRTAQCDVQLTPPKLGALDPEGSWEVPADEEHLEAPADWCRVPNPTRWGGRDWTDLLCPTCAASAR